MVIMKEIRINQSKNCLCIAKLYRMCSMSLRHVHDSGVLLQTTASLTAGLLMVGQGDLLMLHNHHTSDCCVKA